MPTQDITVYYGLPTRIAILAAPATEISIQDLHDSLSDIDGVQANLIYDHTVESSGKVSLGGGVTTGITLQLRNCRFGFEKRTNLLQSGTITTASGMTGDLVRFIDSAATFITNGVEIGDIVANEADGSHTNVAQVVSETELLVFSPSGGTENDYDVGESYNIWEMIYCSVTNGNLAAFDDMDNEIDPLFPSFGTYATIAQSTTAALVASIQPDDFVTALRTEVFDGETFEDMLRNLKSWGYGRFVESATGVFDYYDNAGTTKLFTLTLTDDGLGKVTRERS